jgi:hypothetical protein
MDNNQNFGYQPTASYPAGQGAGQGTGPGRGQRPGKAGGRGRLIAGGVAAAVLVGGAAFGAATMLSGSSASAAAGPTGQAAVLSDALTGATTPATTTSTGATTTASTAAQTRYRRDALARLRRLGGIDGQFTFETKSGPKTLAFERGTIQSVSGNDVVVKAKDGTTWNWTLVSDSVVREDGSKTTNSALTAGELVFVGGPVVSGSHDARLIVVRDAQKSGSTGSSPSASTSAAIS